MAPCLCRQGHDLTQDESDLYRFMREYRRTHYTITLEEFNFLMSVVERVPRLPPLKSQADAAQEAYIVSKGDWGAVVAAVLEHKT
jgi:hypothetical protein